MALHSEEKNLTAKAQRTQRCYVNLKIPFVLWFLFFLCVLCAFAVNFLVLPIAGFGQCVHDLAVLRHEYRPAEGLCVEFHLFVHLAIIGNERHLEFLGFLGECRLV